MFDRPSAGLLMPLFSIRSHAQWGVGEFPDLPAFARVAKRGGFSYLLTLPLLESAPGQESPYSSCSFFALDPLFIRVTDVDDALENGEVTLDDEEKRTLTWVRSAPAIDHRAVRWLKDRVLRRAHARFVALSPSSERRARFLAFSGEHAAWLETYAVFRAIKHLHPESFHEWPAGLRDAEPSAVAAFRQEHASEIDYRRYLQWLAFEQHAAARAACREAGIALGGDEPFLVANDSADVWGHREQFRFDATVGAPPDAFSADGQEWGLPPYRWDALEANGYALFATRAAHAARLYDLVRIDHVVGLYRTYVRPLDKSTPYFVPDEEARQHAQGDAVLRRFLERGLAIIAEDLGVIPPFVRTSLEGLQIPGYRVLRWEQEHGRFRQPGEWPALSLATSGTHDTETSREWWERLPEWERRAVAEFPELQGLGAELRFTETVWEGILRTLYRSASRSVLLPVQDVFALRERINTPNTMGPENWSFRLPWTSEALASDEIMLGRLEKTRALAESTGRLR